MKTLIILLFCPLVILGQTTGKVIAITDGDTFVFLQDDSSKIKIRFHRIDCPESGQSYSKVCKNFLSDLIFQKEILTKEKGLDRYGRTLAIVFRDSVNINERLLVEGMAWHYKQYDKNAKWASLENEARINKKGLWQDNNPIPPWNWRKNKFNSNLFFR